MTLGELVVDFQSGFASGDDTDDGVVQVRMNNLDKDGRWNWGRTRRVQAGPEQLKKYGLDDGDILFNNTNSPELVGRGAAWVPIGEPTTFSNHFTRFRIDKARAEPRYLGSWFQWLWKSGTIQAFANQWVNQAAIRPDAILGLPVPLPPLAEQQRIADILDAADALRRKRREALRLLDELQRATFLEMFGDPVTNPKGWPVAPLAAVAGVKGGLQVTHARSDEPNELPYLRVANVMRGMISLDEVKRIRVSDRELSVSLLDPGDVLFVEGHGNSDEVGRAAVWHGELASCTHQNHLIRARPRADIVLPAFLAEFANSAGGRSYFKRASKTTSGLNTISTEQVRLMPVMLPTMRVQAEFARVSKSISSEKARYAVCTTTTETLFAALLDRAFRGDL